MSAGPVTIAWRRLDAPGHDAARLCSIDDGWQLEGVAVFVEDDKACCLRYTVSADERWHTVSSRISGWAGDDMVDIEIAADAGRRWTLNGAPVPGVDGCIDIDLAFTPATNVLPIRRLAPAVGSSIAARAAWLTFPALALEPLEQTYRRLDERRYAYESLGGAFRATLEFVPEGFVTDYPGLWTVEGAMPVG